VCVCGRKEKTNKLDFFKREGEAFNQERGEIKARENSSI
jgi:hypothetical protein